jgi:hypothetical protein
MVPSGRGVGLAAGFEAAPLRGVGEAVAVGSAGSAPGVGYGAKVGNGAGVPIGAIEGMAPGVGKVESEFVWPLTKTSEARKIPAAIDSFLIVGM